MNRTRHARHPGTSVVAVVAIIMAAVLLSVAMLIPRPAAAVVVIGALAWLMVERRRGDIEGPGGK